MAGGGEKQRTLEDTPTWAVSVCCFFFLIISLFIEGSMHKLTEILKKMNRVSLGKALSKTKTEMMKFGFMSFLLTIAEVPISQICINRGVANTFLPCRDIVEDHIISPEEIDPEENYCEAKGMVSLVSGEGILQLNILISFLAVFHILYCTLTMCLGKLKMRRWKKWEDETQTIEYQIANDSRRFQSTVQTLGGKRHLRFWSSYTPWLWMVCLIRQFYGSVSKDDYFALRNGFIAANVSTGSSFNFKKFLSRSYDEDFEKVVGTRFWTWVFSILFIFLSAHKFYNYYWLPFIPLVVALLAGAKLQVIITNMYVDGCKENPVIKGTLLVKPSDEYFWFNRPEWLLNLLQFILIQNSFQLAFFSWTWYEFGPRSCFNREKEDIAIRICMGIAVQILCGYVTLPLYALVTQMGSNMKRAVFSERVSQGLKNWHKKAKRSISKTNSICSRHSASVRSKANENSIREASLSMESHVYKGEENNEDHIIESVVVMSNPPHPPPVKGENNEEIESVKMVMSNSPSSGEEESEKSNVVTVKEVVAIGDKKKRGVEGDNPKMIARGNYDGEISFGSSWKDLGMSSRGIGEIVSIVEETDTTDNHTVVPVPHLIP